MKFKELFPQKTIIGAVHFMPLPGFDGFEGIPPILKKAEVDTTAFINGGVDALIFENNYDYPHEIFVSKEVTSTMVELVSKISPSLPYGISVLWNDYKAALDIAKKTNGKFIRIPVFVDKVKTSYGIVDPVAEEAVSYRKKIGAEAILLLTDIHVKHAELLSSMTLQESAKKAIEMGSDGLIITGKWTGDAPIYEDLKLVRDIIGDFPIIIGSGASAANIKKLLKYADAAIVSTALKFGEEKVGEVNLKPYSIEIDKKRVKDFMSKVFK